MIHIDKQQFGPWAIVTGASSGIGKEFAYQLAANGLYLVLVARRLPLLEELGQELSQKFGIQYRAVGADLSEETFLEKVEAAAGDLDVGLVISNAGTGNPGAFLSLEYSQLRQIVHLNVLSHLRLVHYYGRQLADRGRGGILMVSAMGASQGLPYMANDAATKAYVNSLGEGLNVEFRKLGVNMTVLLPGPTETPILEKFGFDAATMPMKPMSVEQCVSEGLTALKANRATHLTGRLNRLMMKLMPPVIMRNLLGTMIAKGVARQHTSVLSESF
jgi:short-subunit dehydrogenase